MENKLGVIVLFKQGDFLKLGRKRRGRITEPKLNILGYLIRKWKTGGIEQSKPSQMVGVHHLMMLNCYINDVNKQLKGIK